MTETHLSEPPSLNPFDQADQAGERKRNGNPFLQFVQPDNKTGPAPEPTAPPPAPKGNPFLKFSTDKDVTATPEPDEGSASGAFRRGFARGVLPAVGGLATFGVGAEAGAAIGAFGGPAAPITVPVASLIGGFATSMLGAEAVSSAQSWALSKLPDSWREAIGQDDRQQHEDEKKHGTASFLGGLVPYALAMRPGGISRANLPENATALQRLMANPVTARVFGGAVMGGMEAGQELAHGEGVDWQKTAIATGFGVVFNKPTAIGERLTELSARPARRLLGRPEPTAEAPPAPAPTEAPPAAAPTPEAAPAAPGEPGYPSLNAMILEHERGLNAPTVAEAGDLKVMGPGITESVFHGSEAHNPTAAMTAHEAARNEAAVLGKGPEPDLHAAARRIEPEAFAHYDELIRQRDTFRRWIEEHRTPSPEALSEIETRQAELQRQHDELVAARGGYKAGPEARRLRAQIREVEAEHTDALSRMVQGAVGGVPDTPEIAAARRHLQATDYELRDLLPEIQAAYRRAADMHEGPAAAEAPAAPAAPPGGTSLASVIAARESNAAPAPIDSSRDVRSGAVASKEPDGPVFIDRHIPQVSPTLKDKDGNPANLWKYLTIHETQERQAMAEGLPYETAHETRATPAERAAVEADGVDWKSYTAEMDGYLSAIEHEGVKNPPPNPHVEPDQAVGGKPHHHSENKPAATAAPAPAAPANVIADDVANRLVAAGRPADEAAAYGKLWAAYYETRAARFNGALGTAEELFRREGARIVGTNEMRRGRPTLEGLPRRAPSSPTGPSARDPETWSLLEFLASRGGIDPADPLIGDVRQLSGGKRKFVPGFGDLVRQGGMRLDRARESAVEAGYLHDEGFGTEAQATSTVSDLLEAMDTEIRGQRIYKHDRKPEHVLAQEQKEVIADNARHADEQFDEALREAEIDPQSIDDKLRKRTIEIMTREGEHDAMAAYERAVMENEVATEPARAEEIEHEYFQRKRRDLIAEREAQGQMGLPGTERIGQGEQAQRAADQPLKPKAEQKPMDIGLFGDEKGQKELFQQPPRQSHETPFGDKWGDPRHDADDAFKAASRLDKIAHMDVRSAPWNEIVQAKQDINEIVAQLYYYREGADLAWFREDPLEVGDYERHRNNMEPADPDSPNVWKRNYSILLDTPDDVADIARAARDAIDHILNARRQGVLDLIRGNRIAEPDRKGIPPGRIAETMRSGFYFTAARKLADVPDALFQQGGQAVLNWLTQAGVKRAEINHFGLQEQFGNTRPATREQFEQAIADRMFDFRRKTRWFNPERSQADYENSGTRAFSGPRVPGRGEYFERAMAFPKKLKGGEVFPPGTFESPHWEDWLKGAWASWRGSVREVPGYGKMMVGEEGQSDYMQGALSGRRPRVSAAEYIQRKDDAARFDNVVDQSNDIAREAFYQNNLPTDIEYALRQDLAPLRYGRELPTTEWQARLQEARQLVDQHTAWGYRETALKKLDELEALRKNNEKFFEPGARAKYVEPAAVTPETPIDRTYVRTMARDLLMFAAKEKVDSVAVSTSETTGRVQNNPGAAHFYDAQVKPAIERELRRMTGDDTLTLEKVDLPKAQGGRREKPYTVWAAKLPETFHAEAKEGFPLFQEARGKIRLIPGNKSIITLMKDANASTFGHETGHEFLDQLMRDAEHPAAPDQLKTDAATTLKWLGADTADAIKTRHHEKFARGFEQYLREGTAPSQGLARVFAQFRDWLVQIYQTLKGLGKEISPDIRDVFDRMLATEPQRTIIAPESLEHRPNLHDTHESDAATMEPHEADAAMARVSAEAERAVDDILPEVRNELETKLAKIEAEQQAAAGAEPGAAPGGGPGEPGQVGNAGGTGGPVTQGSGGSEGAGAVVGSGGETRPASAGLSGRSGERSAVSAADADRERQRAAADLTRDHPLAPGPADLFGAAESPFTDKAGNIRLENLTTREDVAQAIRDAATANDDFIGDRRGVITDGQVMDLAEDLGMDFQKLDTRKIGEAFNAEQIMAARKLLVQSATDLTAIMRKAAVGTDEDVMLYAAAKDRHQMIQAHVAGITAEAGRALRAFRNIAGMEATQGVDQFLRTATGKTLFQLKQEAKLGAQLGTPQNVSKFMQDAQKRTFGRMLLEYWINGLLSGPATHSTNLIGNAVLMVQNSGPETAAAALIGRARQALGREGEVIRFGELGARLRGLRQGLPSGIKGMAQSFRSGTSMLLPGEKPAALPFQIGNELVPRPMLDEAATYSSLMADAFGTVQGLQDSIVAMGALIKAGGIEGSPLVSAQYSIMGAIPDIAVRGVTALPLGTAIRTPGRFLAAADSFFRAVNYSMAKNATAYRMASNEGLTGTRFDARVAEIRQSPSESMMKSLAGEAAEQTLMEKGGKFLQALSHLSNAEIGGFPLLKFVSPFVHVAGNIINQALIKRTPLAYLSAELRADLTGKNGNIAQDKAMARVLIGTGLSVAFGTLAAQGYATGSGPTDPKEAAMWRLAGNQAYSVRIGDIWYGVQKLGPLGMMLSTAADLHHVAGTASEGEMADAAGQLVHAFSQNILDQSMMKGPAELLRAINDSDRYGEQYVRNFLASFVPFSVGMAQMAKLSDPYSRHARTIVDAMRAKIPGHLNSWFDNELMPKRDIWGEPLLSPETIGGPGVTGIYQRQMSTDPVNQAMLRLGIAPGPVSRKIRNEDLTDQQYDDFARIAGRTTKIRLDTIVKSPDFQGWAPTVQHDVIVNVIRQSREMARGTIMVKYPEIVRQAIEERKAKARGENIEPIQ